MDAIFVLKMTHFLAYSSQSLLHKIKKYNFRFCNKIFWVGPIFLGRLWEGKHLIFYFRTNCETFEE